MIRALSPYNLTIPFVSPNSGLQCTKYTLQLWIYDGAEAGAPIGDPPTKEITKNNTANSSGNDTVNIASILADYIEQPLPSGSGVEFLIGNSMKWLYARVIYYNPNAETAQFLFQNLFNRAYSYTMEGENVVSVADNILVSGREFKVSRNSVFLLPIYTPENTEPATTVASFPNAEMNYDPVTPLGITQKRSSTSSLYLWIDCSEIITDEYIVVNVGGVEVVLLVEQAYKYTPVDIIFQNKSGHFQTLTFFKERKDELTTKKETYQSSGLQPLAGNHQFITYNVNGRESFKVQSGWQDEDLNDTFRQLLVSEKIWHLDNGIFTPLNIKTSQLSYKTQKIDRLIQYEIEFENSFNVINNI